MTDETRLETLRAVATNVVLPMGMTLDEVVLDVGSGSVGWKPFVLALNEPAAYTVRLSEGNIARFLEAKAPGGLKDFGVDANGGLLTVEATGRFIVEVRVSAVCRLRIVDEGKLFADLESVSLSVARGIVEQQLAKINPILDLSEFADRVSMDAVKLEDGFVTVEGRADWPQSG